MALGWGCQLRRGLGAAAELEGAPSTPPFASVSRKKFLKKGASQSFGKAARLKWQSLERRIVDIVMQRMTIVNLEADMERLIKVGAGLRAAGSAPRGLPPLRPPLVPPPLLLAPALQSGGAGGDPKRPASGRAVDRAGQLPEASAPPRHPQKREELFVLQEALRRKRERLQAESPEEEKGLQELAEEIEALAANIDYINDSISDCQATIVQLEETKVPVGRAGRRPGGAWAGGRGQPG